MANLRDIRRRIKSVKNTAQITKAMQMVAASKMRKAQEAAMAGRPYADTLNRVLVSLRDNVDPSFHPLLEQRKEIRNELVILISTDKGLCGALNTNLFREAAALDSVKTKFISLGRKGTQFLSRSQKKLLADFTMKDQPVFLEVKAVSKYAIEQFLSGEVDKVSVLFPRFVNTLVQTPTMLPLLPITSLTEAGLASPATEKETESTEVGGGTMTFEPKAESVLDAILPFYVHFELYQMLLGARASEQSARMVAMKNATDNAKQLVKDLTLEYNKARQAGITTELLEIATAQLALN